MSQVNKMDTKSTFLPAYDFSLASNLDLLKAILPILNNHKIAANPINYAICYDYVAGHNATLSKAVDLLIEQNKPFDRDTSLELYGKHICSASLASFENINNQIQKVIEQTSGAIIDTCSKAEETNDSFQKKSIMLENIADSTGINQILKEIIEETRSLSLISQAMQTKLNDANREMEQLRSELEQVRQISVTDGLTGLLNRRAFDQTLAQVIEQSKPETAYLSLLDIDHFKKVNDTYGHTIGDNVIKFVASLMKQHAEEHHHVARYGGEELAIIMPDTPKEKAIEISETIRMAMENSNLKRKSDNQPLGKITLSIGIAKLQDQDNPDSFIVRADKALYQAKETGRNKVVH
jgi:diguanylate cyclase